MVDSVSNTDNKDDFEDEVLFSSEELAEEFATFCQQHPNPDEQNAWFETKRQEDLAAQHNVFMKKRDMLNEWLIGVGYECDAVTDKDIENARRFAYGLMNDNNFKDEILRAYYYFIWGASQKSLANSKEIQSVLSGSEDFIDINVIRQHVTAILKKLQKTNQVPEKFTYIETAHQCLREQIAFFKHSAATQEEAEKIDTMIQKAIHFVLRQQFLGPVCEPFIIACLANPFAENMERMADYIVDQLTYPAQMASVVSIDAQGITIRFQKGIQRKEYLEVWDVIKNELDTEYNADGSESLKARLVFLHHMEKVPYSQIAKAYYPDYYNRKANGKENAEDLVRNTIKQYLKKYKGLRVAIAG